MSMLPYESVPQRGGSCNLRVTVFCVCFVLFLPPWSWNHLFGSLPKMLCRLLQLMWPQVVLCLYLALQHTIQLNHPWLLPDGRSFRCKGNPQKARWRGFKEQIPKLKAWMKYRRQTHHLKGKVSLQCISVWTLFVLTVIFPNYHEERRKTGTATSSNNPFDLTNEQNITVMLIRGWTVSESMVPHYPNHCYFPWLRFEVLSI